MDMPVTILPAFITCSKEASIIGRLLAGYGELEFVVYECVKAAIGHSSIAVRLMFRVRSEKTRLDLADAILRPICESNSLNTEYQEAMSAADYCRKVRNQYSHCHWLGDKDAGLFFSNIEPSAQKKSGEITMAFLHIDDALLQKQEAYFAQTQVRFFWLSLALQKAAAKQPIPRFSIGKPVQQPPRHNPPEQHPLPKKETIPPPSDKEPDKESGH
jgi:hypothetical protein